MNTLFDPKTFMFIKPVPSDQTPATGNLVKPPEIMYETAEDPSKQEESVHNPSKIVETDNLRTVKNYASDNGVTTAYIYKLIKLGKLEDVDVSGIKFIDIEKFPSITGKERKKALPQITIREDLFIRFENLAKSCYRSIPNLISVLIENEVRRQSGDELINVGYSTYFDITHENKNTLHRIECWMNLFFPRLTNIDDPMIVDFINIYKEEGELPVEEPTDALWNAHVNAWNQLNGCQIIQLLVQNLDGSQTVFEDTLQDWDNKYPGKEVWVISALGNNEGLYIEVYHSMWDVPQEQRNFEGWSEKDYIRLHHPSALRFWGWLNKQKPTPKFKSITYNHFTKTRTEV